MNSVYVVMGRYEETDVFINSIHSTPEAAQRQVEQEAEHGVEPQVKHKYRFWYERWEVQGE